MSEPVPASEPRSSGGGVKGALTRKIGPLPTWGWIVIVAAGILAWSLYRKRSGSASSGSASSTDTAGSGQIPQFVNQTFTTVQPPSAPDQDRDEGKGPPPKPGKPPADKDAEQDEPGTPHHPKKPHRRRHPVTEGKVPLRRPAGVVHRG